MKYLIIALSSLLVTGCTTLDLKTVDKNAKVLLLTQTRDIFDIYYRGMHVFPALMSRYIEQAPFEVKLSNLFVDTVLANADKSTFEFITIDNPNIDSSSKRGLGGFNQKLMDLAKSNGADYILALHTTVIMNEHGHVTQDSHYGFGNTVDLGFTKYYVEGYPYLHGWIDLIDANQTAEGLVGNKLMVHKTCYGYDHGIKPRDQQEIDMPTSLDEGELVASIKPEVLEIMRTRATGHYQKIITRAMEDCGLIPSTRPPKKNRYKRDR